MADTRSHAFEIARVATRPRSDRQSLSEPCRISTRSKILQLLSPARRGAPLAHRIKHAARSL
jgi:hypothetical protein